MVLALAWAVYLIPKALKHHDEVARTRSVDRFSTAMRVLARREPVNHRQARLVVTPPRPADAARILLPSLTTSSSASTASTSVPSTTSTSASVTEDSAPSEVVRRTPVRPAARRAAARAAARRRRHVLLLLLLADLVVIGLAAFAVLPWWSVVVPVSLTVAYLVLCRTQVRRENEASWTRDLDLDGTRDHEQPGTAEVAPRRAIRIDAAYGTPQSSRNEQGLEEVSPDEDTVTLPAHVVAAAVNASSVEEAELLGREVEAVAVSVPTVDGGSLWDPLPVTLPTYVGKSRASRTVRTIELGEPGSWTSGRSEADSKLVEEAAAAQEQEATEAEDQRAVGS